MKAKITAALLTLFMSLSAWGQMVSQTADNGWSILSVNIGQSFTATTTASIGKISVRPSDAFSGRLLVYNGSAGSGTVGAVGTPAYSQAGVSLYSSTPGGAMRDIVLTTPFPVLVGNTYTFILEGAVGVYVAHDSNPYADGKLIIDYANLASNAASDLAFQVWSWQGALILQNPTNAVNAQVGVAYQLPLIASGGTGNYTAYALASNSAALPTGLSLNTSTGAITGTPTAAGSYPVTVQVTDSAGDTAFWASTVNIDKGLQTLNISSPAPTNAKVGGSYAVITLPGKSTAPVTLAATGNCALSGSNVRFDAAGSCTVTASQQGDANFLDAANATQTFSIAQSGSGVNISATPNPSLPGQEVSFTITVALDSTKSLKAQSGLTKASVVPTGTVTLSDGATTLGTATPLDANGNATVTVKTLTSVGTHSIVATYSGDANFAAVQSAALIQTVSAAPVATPVPLFGELWEKLLLSLMVGVSALLLRMRRA